VGYNDKGQVVLQQKSFFSLFIKVAKQRVIKQKEWSALNVFLMMSVFLARVN
jgi:hypothetical protein